MLLVRSSKRTHPHGPVHDVGLDLGPAGVEHVVVKDAGLDEEQAAEGGALTVEGGAALGAEEARHAGARVGLNGDGRQRHAGRRLDRDLARLHAPVYAVGAARDLAAVGAVAEALFCWEGMACVSWW